MSTEITPLGSLGNMDDIGEGRLGMITTFCQSDQVKMEPSDTLSALVQWDSPELGVVVLKVFTNSPYFPWGSFSYPYHGLNHPFSRCTSTTQFPLALLYLCMVAPMFFHSGHPSVRERGGLGLKVYPIPCMETLWESSEEEHHLSHPVPLSLPIISSHSNRDTSMQTEEVLNFNLSLRQLQAVTQAKAQLEWGLVLKLQGLMRISGTKNHWGTSGPEDQDGSETRGPMGQDGWAGGQHLQAGPLSDESGQFGRGFFLGFSLPLLSVLVLVPHAQWLKHSLPSCSQGQYAPTDDTIPEFKGTTALASISSPVHSSHHSTSSLSLCPDILATGTLVGHPFFTLAIGPKHKKLEPPTPASTLEGQSSKRAHVLTLMEDSISSWHAALHLSSWQPVTALNSLSLSSSISPPVQSRLLPTPMMDGLWSLGGAL